eukprot:CAMPEP_0198730582 /NCGR_PEP_ID=MMETSP1475-20131203/25184_1 /TAXON_ID= ORGANISM="Unidentified sp., Strain CCMP1999" /NCGR_SAMPLE_ID=MMETSP1475 /ASSEMBLY_ACC=CAM_ASM_001111 /LENGTH=357 /DNA_ID=CAMNT_0044493401 /DNA_START=81 /DNA_END=1154 /DNA_ORIENTATION=-
MSSNRDVNRPGAAWLKTLLSTGRASLDSKITRVEDVSQVGVLSKEMRVVVAGLLVIFAAVPAAAIFYKRWRNRHADENTKPLLEKNESEVSEAEKSDRALERAESGTASASIVEEILSRESSAESRRAGSFEHTDRTSSATRATSALNEKYKELIEEEPLSTDLAVNTEGARSVHHEQAMAAADADDNGETQAHRYKEERPDLTEDTVPDLQAQTAPPVGDGAPEALAPAMSSTTDELPTLEVPSVASADECSEDAAQNTAQASLKPRKAAVQTSADRTTRGATGEVIELSAGGVSDIISGFEKANGGKPVIRLANGKLKEVTKEMIKELEEREEELREDANFSDIKSAWLRREGNK